MGTGKGNYVYGKKLKKWVKIHIPKKEMNHPTPQFSDLGLLISTDDGRKDGTRRQEAPSTSDSIFFFGKNNL